MKTYLSIDFDYWRTTWPKLGVSTITDVVKRAKKRGIPIIAVMNHQQMLKEVNESYADRLINVDEHADLSGADVEVLNCGTWVSYVRWRRGSEYLWIRNSRSTSLGDCNGSGGRWNFGTDWYKTTSKYGGKDLRLTPFLRNCVGVGLCMSPEFSTETMQDFFRELVRENGIQYRKGRHEESIIARTLKPPFRG
jgi:hypothetical protein